MKLALPIALMLMVLSMSCDAVLGIDLATYGCGELKDRVIELSEEQQNPFSPVILKVSEIEETSRTAKRLDCYGVARLNNGGQEGIAFHIEEDVDGDFLYGYEAGSKPIQRSLTPTPTVVVTRPPTPEAPTSTALPIRAQQNSLPTQLPTSTPIPGMTPEISGTPHISATVAAYRATLVAIAAATPPTPSDEATPAVAPTPSESSQVDAPCCISVGSSKEEVLALLGEPVSVTVLSRQEEWWTYANFQITMHPSAGRILSWSHYGSLSQSPFDFLASLSTVQQSNPEGHISVGDTAEYVIAVLGEPDSVSVYGRNEDTWWQYYNSAIYVDPNSELVTSWGYAGPLSDSPFERLMSITAIPHSNPGGRISIGSTAGEVVSRLGEPDQAIHWKSGGITFQFYNSAISFDDHSELVTSWEFDGNLIDSPFERLAPITSTPRSNPSGHILVGSTADEVVSILGEPDLVVRWSRWEDITWQYYPNTTISFSPSNGTVVEWYWDGPEDESPFR